MVSQHYDTFFKGLGINDAFSLINIIPLEMLEIISDQLVTKTVNFNPTELMSVDLKTYRADLIIELDHVILMFEFQATKIYLDDKRRFNIYTAIKDRDRAGDKPIYLIVFSTVEKTQVIDYQINPTCSFKILVISLKNQNGTEILNNIESKIKNNQKINQNDLTALGLSSLMTLETSIEEHLERSVQILNKLRHTIKKELQFVFALVFILIDKFIKDDETRERLSNILCDNMKLIEEYLQRKHDEWKREGKTEGIEKRNWEIAEELLNDDMTMNRISEITNVPIDQLETLNNNRM